MFYCDPCAREREWPISMARSLGSCELCGRKRVCNDVHPSKIPGAKDDASQTGKTEEVAPLDRLKRSSQRRAHDFQGETRLLD